MLAKIQKSVLLRSNLRTYLKVKKKKKVLPWTGTPKPSICCIISWLNSSHLFFWFIVTAFTITNEVVLCLRYKTKSSFCADIWSCFQNKSIQDKLLFQAFYLFNKGHHFLLQQRTSNCTILQRGLFLAHYFLEHDYSVISLNNQLSLKQSLIYS